MRDAGTQCYHTIPSKLSVILGIIAVIVLFLYVGYIQVQQYKQIEEYCNNQYDDNTRIAIESLNQTLQNLEIPNLMVYSTGECLLNVDRQEWWCMRIGDHTYTEVVEKQQQEEIENRIIEQIYGG